MIEEIAGYLVIFLFCITIVVIVDVCNILAEKSKAKKELLAQQKQDKLAQKEYEKILKQMQCKWDDKAECRQNRECDYCSEINCLRKVSK